MALTRLHSKYAGRGMKNAPKGNVKGKMPSMPGHPVGEHGMKNAPRGMMKGVTPKSGGSRTGGRGVKT